MRANHPLNHEVTAHDRHLAPLIGATILDARAYDDGEGFYQTMRVRLKNGVETWVTALADAEGNGPGHLEMGPS